MDKICSVSESVGRWVWMLSVRAGEEGEAARLKPPVAARGGVRGAARGGRQSIAGGRPTRAPVRRVLPWVQRPRVTAPKWAGSMKRTPKSKVFI
jgi:hypothetical protein